MPLEPRRGQTARAPRYTGVILFLFGLPFFLGGLFFCFGFLLDDGKGWALRIGGALFGLLFALICGLFLYGCVGIILGWPDIPKGEDKPQNLNDTWETSKFFPKPKGRPSSRGGVLLWRDPTNSPNPFSFFLLVLFWNAFVGAFFYFVFFKARSLGMGEYFAMAVLSLFALIGLFMIGVLVKRIVQLLVTGTLAVGLQEEPVRAGEKTRLLVTLARNHQVRRARVTLLCQETARHGSGTDVVTTKEVVLEKVVHERQDIRATGGTPCIEIDLPVPPDAIHSFTSKSNDIVWFLEIFLDIPGKPDIKERYEFRVAPGR